jgi:hypothetical protein
VKELGCARSIHFPPPTAKRRWDDALDSVAL